MTDFNRTDLAGAIEALTVTVGNLLLASDGGKNSRNLEIAAEIVGENLYSACVSGDYDTALRCLDDAVQYLSVVVGSDDRIMDFRVMKVRGEIKDMMPKEKTLRASAVVEGDRIDIGGTFHVVQNAYVEDGLAWINFGEGTLLVLHQREPVTVLTGR